MIVADTNLLAYLLITGPQTGAAEAVFDKDSIWAAPLLWRSEFRNLLVLQMRHRGLALQDANRLWHNARDVIGEREFDVNSEGVLSLAWDTGLTAYDAEYLFLARELDVLLVTADEAILKAAPNDARRPDQFSSTV